MRNGAKKTKVQKNSRMHTFTHGHKDTTHTNTKKTGIYYLWFHPMFSFTYLYSMSSSHGFHFDENSFLQCNFNEFIHLTHWMCVLQQPYQYITTSLPIKYLFDNTDYYFTKLQYYFGDGGFKDLINLNAFTHKHIETLSFLQNSNNYSNMHVCWDKNQICQFYRHVMCFTCLCACVCVCVYVSERQK